METRTLLGEKKDLDIKYHIHKLRRSNVNYSMTLYLYTFYEYQYDTLSYGSRTLKYAMLHTSLLGAWQCLN